MACTLQPKCNFLHGFFRWHLPVETVDVEVRITSMQGTHTFKRDRTCQVIKCNPWSIRLCSHPTIIKEMKTYLELEGKLGPKLQSQSNQFRPVQPNTNPHVRKDSKATEKRKRLIPTKKYKVKVITRPDSNNMTMQPSLTSPKAPVTSEAFARRYSREHPPSLDNIPVCASTPWSEAGKMSVNLFELRKDWLIPPTNNTANAASSKPPIKIEP